MNKLQQIVSRKWTVIMCLVALSAYSQKETKTYSESFKVGNDAVIDINTSHADIEFETWDKNEVVIEAIVELEGATKEEAADYFKKGGIKILGNSKIIEISTKAENSFSFGDSFSDMDIIVNDFVIEIPEFPELEPLFLDLEIPDLPDFPEMMELPPIPSFSGHNFDYKAYKKDGEKYLKKWKKEFAESFDEDYKQRMIEWSERMEERSKAWKERKEERKESMKQRMEEHQERMEEKKAQLMERQKERQEVQKERLEALKDSRKALLERSTDSSRFIYIDRDNLYNGPSIFFGSSHGGNKKYKVKKTIKIKMPKSTKLKMNVRHGEVKLAENTFNMKATLSYARLLATNIDGERTNIVASYSPVSVQSWDNGSLNTNFSEKVALKDVKYLRLSANSSDVTIERLLKSAQIKNNLGALRINGVAKNFKDLDISVQHGELNFELPTTPYTIYVNGTSSKLTSPSYLVWDKTESHSNTVQKSYHINRNAESSIIINSAYSNVVLQK